jgi:hypothetical protein
MRRKLPLGVLVILVLAVVTLPAASASSSQASSSARDDNDVEVIRVTGVTVDEAILDLGAPGDSLGDQFVETDDLFRGGEKVGFLGLHCTAMRQEPMVSFTLQCVATAELPRGQITVQGLVTFTETAQEPIRVAITGGTGRYRTAHGVLTVREISVSEDLLTFRIIR